MADSSNKEFCPKCNEKAERVYSARITFIGTKVFEAEYNPGLGCVIKSQQHKKDIMKAKGVEEVGSEPPDKLHKYYDEKRSEKLEKTYDEVTKGWVGNGDA